MTHENKQLLLKDLCARLPYYTELYSNVADGNWAILTPVIIYNLINADKDLVIKPYLRPMSSMTEKECIALSRLRPHETDAWKYIKTPIPLYIANIKQFDFFHRHHLDWRGLILMGLALEAPKDMYKTE